MSREVAVAVEVATGPALAVIPGPHLYILNTIFCFPGIAGGRDFLTAGSSSSVVFVLLFIHAVSPLLVLQHFTDFPFQIQHNGFSFRFGCFPRDC